jgi:hypothetical protein
VGPTSLLVLAVSSTVVFSGTAVALALKLVMQRGGVSFVQ